MPTDSRSPTLARFAVASLPLLAMALHCGTATVSSSPVEGASNGSGTVDDIDDAGASSDGGYESGNRREGGGGRGAADGAPSAADSGFGPPPLYTRLSVGQAHACAILSGGSVKCWGSNAEGRLGIGDTASRGHAPGTMGANLPSVALGTGRTAVSVSAGATVTCAILDDGRVKCWGFNGTGGLGLGDLNNRGDQSGEMGDALPAVDLGSGRTARNISVGLGHACAVLDTGALKCWGENSAGQLGLGDRKARGASPVEMSALAAVDLGPGRKARAVHAGTRQTCVLLDDESVKCWGDNDLGTLGLGDSIGRGANAGEMGAALPAINLGPGARVLGVASGLHVFGLVADPHTCALLVTGAAKCWGSNGLGQLGVGDTDPRGKQPSEMGASLPVVGVGVGRTIAHLALGLGSTCAILDNGQLKCWGYNAFGQLGLGDKVTRDGVSGGASAIPALPPVDVGSGRMAKQIAVGTLSVCAILDNGSIRCWGDNSAGQLGLGDVAARGDNPGEMGDALPVVVLE